MRRLPTLDGSHRNGNTVRHTALYHILEMLAARDPSSQGFGRCIPVRRTHRKALEEALAGHREKHPGEIPPWKEVHRNYFTHISHSSAFETDQWIPTPGNEFSVNPGTADWKDEGYYSHRAGASLRLLVEMSSPPTAYFALPGKDRDTEQHDFSDEGSPWRKWRSCQYDKVPFPLDWKGLKTDAVDF